jgi:hypothetical protein
MPSSSHRFKIGQKLNFSPSRWSMRATAQSADCKILRLLPADQGGENLYRVKCMNELFERNVRESELLESELS